VRPKPGQSVPLEASIYWAAGALVVTPAARPLPGPQIAHSPKNVTRRGVRGFAAPTTTLDVLTTDA
jgi:hypothetical protein